MQRELSTAKEEWKQRPETLSNANIALVCAEAFFGAFAFHRCFSSMARYPSVPGKRNSPKPRSMFGVVPYHARPNGETPSSTKHALRVLREDVEVVRHRNFLVILPAAWIENYSPRARQVMSDPFQSDEEMNVHLSIGCSGICDHAEGNLAAALSALIASFKSEVDKQHRSTTVSTGPLP